jgi:hypothetical protein
MKCIEKYMNLRLNLLGRVLVRFRCRVKKDTRFYNADKGFDLLLNIKRSLLISDIKHQKREKNSRQNCSLRLFGAEAYWQMLGNVSH